MEERNDMDKVDEVLLPGFRFHPTDEELVGFYLMRKVQQKPLAIELIRQLDIYKYDPWDLPNLSPTTGEKEWYFYCPRDRKYRNSSRPNRVAVAGFWKATGTDRPIYSSEETKCIGLKKSLVFYRGKAAKGTKTDWMMHEFRLPSVNNSSKMPSFEKNIHPNDSWAICRIFKKTSSMVQRALNQSMVTPIHEIKNYDMFSSVTNSPVSDTKNSDGYPLQDFTSYEPTNLNNCKPSPVLPISEIPTSFMFSPQYSVDVASMFLNFEKAPASIDFGQLEVFDNLGRRQEDISTRKSGGTSFASNDQLGSPEGINFPFELPWDYSSP